MPQDSFQVSEWTSRLSNCLAELINYQHRVESGLQRLRRDVEWEKGIPHSNRLDHSREHVRERIDGHGALAHSREVGRERPYSSEVLWRLDYILRVLLEHPVIKKSARVRGDDLAIGVNLVRGQEYSRPIRSLVRNLLHFAMDHTPEGAAETLADLMQRGEDHDLSSYQVALFHGLHVERRHDFTGALSVVPFEEIWQCLSLHPITSLFRGSLDVGRDPVGAVVYEHRWGPLFFPPSFDTGVEWVKEIKSFREDARLLIDLLAATHKVPVMHSGWQSLHPEEGVEALLGSTTSFGRESNRLWEKFSSDEWVAESPAISEDAIARCGQLYPLILGGDVRLRLALSRLASSLSRTGELADFDRTFDLAVALEALYELGSARDKGSRLSSEARQLIGRNRPDNKWIGGTAVSLYRVRSAVVYGEMPEDSAAIYEDVFELAYRTLAHRSASWAQGNCS